MGFASTFVPMAFHEGCRSEDVPFPARVSNLLFGAPNARRANGIVSTSFDLAGWLDRVAARLFGRRRNVPVFAIDRMGTEFRERLPRIWLSEKVSNTRHDGMRRVFVESYPSAPDHGGAAALELGDRYLGEGMKARNRMPKESLECFKAARDPLPPFRPQGEPRGRGASQAHLFRGPLPRRLLEAAPGRARQACKKENARAHRRRASAIVVRMKARPPGH